MTAQATSKARLVYVLAASHSGSTLTALLLAGHERSCTVGELKLGAMGDADSYLCSCRAPIHECPFWLSVAAEMRASGFDFSVSKAGTDLMTDATPYVRRLLRPLHRARALERVRDLLLNLSPQWRASLPRIQARNAALVRSIQKVAGADVVVDSSKTALRLKYLLRSPELDVRVVRLVRDGRACALTYMNPGRFADATDEKLRGGGRGKSNDSFVMSATRAAEIWRRSNEEADAALAALPADRYIRLRYEDLCSDPAAALDQAFRFVGLDPGKRIAEFRSVPRHVIGNGMRFDTTSEIRLDDRWKDALNRGHLDEFDRAAGELNRSYGYD